MLLLVLGRLITDLMNDDRERAEDLFARRRTLRVSLERRQWDGRLVEEKITWRSLDNALWRLQRPLRCSRGDALYLQQEAAALVILL